MMPAENHSSVLYIGGCRSGKSRLAEEYVSRFFRRPCYVATMASSPDGELQERIARHQQRRGPAWQLVEEPRDLQGVLAAAADVDVLLIDCLTMWLTNLLLAELSDTEIEAEMAGLLAAIESCPRAVVLVANEVGLGIVPDNALARRFRDLAGLLNQHVAHVCQRVILVAAGLPLTLKG